MEKTAWRFAKSFGIDLAAEISDNKTTKDKQPRLHPTKVVKRKIVNELQNGKSCLGNVESRNMDSSTITPPPSSHENDTISSKSKEKQKSTTIAQVNPLDSPASRIRASVRKLTSIEEVQATSVDDVEVVVEPSKDQQNRKKTRGHTKNENDSSGARVQIKC